MYKLIELFINIIKNINFKLHINDALEGTYPITDNIKVILIDTFFKLKL